MGKKRRLFTGNAPIGGKGLKSRRVARVVTSKYHAIRNEMQSCGDNKERMAELEKELEAIGGTDKYQQASIVSTSHFKTSRWVVKMIEQHLGRSSAKIRVLEVGAINIQLHSVAWLDVRSIDVNSQHPLIEELDFFDLPPEQAFDVVVCSMVVNCVTEAAKRGEMLARLRGHLRSEESLLLLVLPSRCIESKHCGAARFESLLGGLGFGFQAPLKTTPRLFFYTLRRGVSRYLGSEEADKLGGKEVSEDDSLQQPPLDSAPKAKSDKKNPKDRKRKRKSEQADEHTDVEHVEEEEAWVLETRAALTSLLPRQLLKHFSSDFSQVPPTEFCINIAPSLTC